MARRDGAARLERELKSRGLTYKDAALEARTTGATISRLVTRERGPSIDLAIRLRRVFGIPIEAWANGSHTSA